MHPASEHPGPPVILHRDTPSPRLRSALRRGDLERVRTGAYTPAVHREHQWQRVERLAWATIHAVARQLGDSAVFSHATAALIHGLWLDLPSQAAHVTQPFKPNGRRDPTLVRHHGRLRASDVTSRHGLRVTSLERTVADCVRTLPARTGLPLADSALRHLCHPCRTDPAAARTRARASRRIMIGHIDAGPKNGRRCSRSVVRLADPLAESPPESFLRWLALSRGLPVPEAQFHVDTPLGHYYADLGWRIPREDGSVAIVLVEYDGRIKYAGSPLLAGQTPRPERIADVVIQEKRREDAIRETTGAAIRRFDRNDLRDPDAVFARLLTAFPSGIRDDLHPRPELL